MTSARPSLNSAGLFLAGAFLYALAPGLSAGVLIESVDHQGRQSKVSIDGDWARIDKEGPEYHLLVDLAQRRAFAVDDVRRIAVDISTPPPKRTKHGELTIDQNQLPVVKLTALGDGPTVAGYPTVHYSVQVNDQPCDDEYLSPALLRLEEVNRFVRAMAQISDHRESILLRLLTDPAAICDASSDLIDDHYPRHGAPMQSVDQGGKIVHRMDRILTDVDFTQETFLIPEGYTLMDREQARQLDLERATDAAHVSAAQQRQRGLIDHIDEAMGRPHTGP